jgi:hypothetical protein
LKANKSRDLCGRGSEGSKTLKVEALFSEKHARTLPGRRWAPIAVGKSHGLEAVRHSGLDNTPGWVGLQGAIFAGNGGREVAAAS